MTKQRFTGAILAMLFLFFSGHFLAASPVPAFFNARNPGFQYTGRIDFSRPAAPRFWMPGAYVTARFRGSHCRILIRDQVRFGTNHNDVGIMVDGHQSVRIRMQHRMDTIDIDAGHEKDIHTIIICKDTESGIGYLDFLGMWCDQLLPPVAMASRRIEFIGNSITCGSGSDLEIPCDSGVWYAQQNALESYGPMTARNLGARWMLSAVSGIGLIHSCCAMQITMPQVFDKLDMRDDSIAWDFSGHAPDVVTICLGQNDGIQDSARFCQAYERFIRGLRGHYPEAKIICLNSPMGNEKLTAVLKNYITAVVAQMRASGDDHVYRFFFSRRFHHGCGGHPDQAEHRIIAGELTGYIRRITGW